MRVFVVVVVFLLSLASNAEADLVDEPCYLGDRPRFDSELSRATVDALVQLEWALLLLERDPPPFRGDPERALKVATKLTRDAWLLSKTDFK